MTLTDNGKNYIADKFGNESKCYVATGLSWSYLGTDSQTYTGTGGTAQIVSRLLMTSLVQSLTISGNTYTYAMLKAGNDGTDILLSDVQTFIALNDGSPSGENQYCYVAPPVLTTITVSPTSASIASGGSQTFTAASIDQYSDPIAATITWTSSVPSAGSFNPTTGTSTVFTAASLGTNTQTIITATSGSVHGSATATVLRVVPVLTTIIVSPTPVNIASGAPQTFTATSIDQYSDPIAATITWTSSVPSAGSFNPTTGTSTVFTAASLGTNTQTIITATSGSVHGSATATVLRAQPVLTTIIVSPGTVTIQTGATHQLHAACKDQYAANFTCPDLIWSSLSESVATVDPSGVVTGIIEGSASITASDGGAITSDPSVIIVSNAPAEAGMGGLLVLGLAFGAIVMGQGTPQTSQGKTKSAQVSRSNIGNN